MPDPVNTTVADAVNAAAAEHGLVETPAEETTESNVETAKVEEAKEEPVQESPDLDERTARALNLLEQLEDAKNGPELVKEMAKRLGLIEQAKTPQQAEKLTKSLKDRVNETLGEDYPILGDRIGTLLEDLLNEQARNFNQELATRDQARYAHDINLRVDKFVAENKVTAEEQIAITKLADKFPPAASVPPEEYLAHQLKVIRWEQAEVKSKTKTNEKIKNNLAESPANSGVAGNEERIVKASRNLTPLQAVQMAARGESVDD